MKDAKGHGSNPRGGAQAVADQHGIPTEHLQPQSSLQRSITEMRRSWQAQDAQKPKPKTWGDSVRGFFSGMSGYPIGARRSDFHLQDALRRDREYRAAFAKKIRS